MRSIAETIPTFVIQLLEINQQSLTIGGNLLPRVRWVHEGRVLDLVVDVLVLVERERPAQADVDDDADAPHVQRAVVALVAQHFRSCPQSKHIFKIFKLQILDENYQDKPAFRRPTAGTTSRR